ncbi:MAG: (Fe-S)-binding protein [Candidatus Freyarchaeota archaeon]
MKVDLEKLKEEMYNCVRCGYCREMVYPQMGSFGVCPLYEMYGYQSYTGKGKVLIGLALLEGRLSMSKSLAEHLFASCLTCKSCTAHCPNEVDVVSIVLALREEAARRGLLPEEIRVVDSNIDKKKNPFGEGEEKRVELASTLGLPETGEVLYFAGCYVTYRYPEVARAEVELLKRAGLNVAYLGEDEWCCGIIKKFEGKPSEYRKLAEHNVEAIKASGAETVVATCPGCYHTLRDYSEILERGAGGFEVVHFTQLLEKLLREGRIKLENPVKKTVTYHDPCHLGRYEEIYEQPRSVLASIPGLRLVEMRRNRRNAWCCGGGATHYVYNFDASIRVALTRLDEAEEAGAEALVTSCPLCLTVFRNALRRAGAKMELYYLSELVRKSLG